MAIIRDDEALSRVRRQPGIYTSPELLLPVDATYAMLVADSRSTWDQRGTRETVLSATLEGFVDGAWVVLGGFTTDASPKVGRDGLPQDTSSIRVRLPRTRQGTVPVRAILQCASPCTGAVRLVLDDTPPPVRLAQEHHSVTYDNDNEAVGANVSSVTIGSFAVGNNANRCLLVGVARYDSVLANSLVSTITHNSSTAGWTEVILRTDSDNDRASISRKVAPAAVSSTVVVTMGGTCDELGAHALSVYDVDQTTPIGTAAGADGTATAPLTATVDVSAATGDLVYDVLYTYGNTLSHIGTVGASQTERANIVMVAYSGARSILLASTEPGAASVTMSWALTNGASTFWCQAACPIKAAVAVLSARTLTLLGVGL